MPRASTTFHESLDLALALWDRLLEHHPDAVHSGMALPASRVTRRGWSSSSDKGATQRLVRPTARISAAQYSADEGPQRAGGQQRVVQLLVGSLASQILPMYCPSRGSGGSNAPNATMGLEETDRSLLVTLRLVKKVRLSPVARRDDGLLLCRTA